MRTNIIEKVIRRQRCLFDDGLFAVAAYRRPEIIDDIVKRVFSKAGIEIRSISRSGVQKRLFSPESRDVIFDCYAETEDGMRMAVEVQNNPSRFSYIREGFYLSKLRVLEDKGKDYDDMLPVYLIILHRHNPYRKYNLPIYSKSCYIENTGIKYSDGMNVLRVNGDYMERGDIIGDLMRSMKAVRPEESELGLYKDALNDIRKEIEMGYTFKDLLNQSWNEGLAEGEAKGKAEGITEGEIRGEARGEAKAKNQMLEAFRRLGVSEEVISKAAESTSV